MGNNYSSIMEENLEYWENIKADREEDIICQDDIGNPDRELMNILLEELRIADAEIEKLNE